MAIYDYKCADCGVFTTTRPMALSDQPCPCPACAAPAQRVFLKMPSLATMDAATRTASSVNEKSRHEPKRASQGHGAGCSCCKTGKAGGAGKTATAGSAAGAAKSFPGTRPWMISH